MQSVERSYRDWKWFESTCKHRWRKFDQRYATEQCFNHIAVGLRITTGVKPVPKFVFQEPAGNDALAPYRRRRQSSLTKQMRQRRRAIEIDQRSSQRSARASSRSFSSSSSVVTGRRGGGSPGGILAGVSQPSRTPREVNSSSDTSFRPGRGGTISATTRLRSVTSTVSPPAAKRTNSLSLFLRSLRPTDRTIRKVATRGYIVNAKSLIRCRTALEMARVSMVNRVLTSPPLWYRISDPAGGPAADDVQDDPPISLCARSRDRLALALRAAA